MLESLPLKRVPVPGIRRQLPPLSLPSPGRALSAALPLSPQEAGSPGFLSTAARPHSTGLRAVRTHSLTPGGRRTAAGARRPL